MVTLLCSYVFWYRILAQVRFSRRKVDECLMEGQWCDWAGSAASCSWSCLSPHTSPPGYARHHVGTPGRDRLLHRQARRDPDHQRTAPHLRRLLLTLVSQSAAQRTARCRGEGYGFSSVSPAGGLLFVALILTGAAVEIVYPATLARFENFQQDAQLGFLSLALSGWLYRFAFVSSQC
jgi:hypothetical protein